MNSGRTRSNLLKVFIDQHCCGNLAENCVKIELAVHKSEISAFLNFAVNHKTMSITPFFKNFFDFPSWEEQERRWNDQEQALQNIFSPSLRKNDWFSPSCDVRETEKEILVHAELPGMAKEDIKLDLKDGVLEISGKKEDRVENKGKVKQISLLTVFRRQDPPPGDQKR